MSVLLLTGAKRQGRKKNGGIVLGPSPIQFSIVRVAVPVRGVLYPVVGEQLQTSTRYRNILYTVSPNLNAS